MERGKYRAVMADAHLSRIYLAERKRLARVAYAKHEEELKVLRMQMALNIISLYSLPREDCDMCEGAD